MNNLKCDCGKRIHVKGREHCATCWRKFTPEGKANGSKRQKDYQQRIKEHFAGSATVAACILAACALPVYASDTLPLGVPVAGPAEQLPPGEPLGYRPVPVPVIAGGASAERLFDAPVGGSIHRLWAPDRGSLVSWNPPGLNRPPGTGNPPDTYGDGRGGICERTETRPPFCRQQPPLHPDVPGPLPVLGIAAAFGWARRLRRRVAS